METKYYVKDICKLTGVEFQKVLEDIKEFDSNFKLKSGNTTEISFNTYKAVCQKHSVEVDESGHITIYKNTDGGKVNFAPTTPVERPKTTINYHENALNEYNKLKCEKIDPLKIKAEFRQYPTNVAPVLEMLKGMSVEKTILNDFLIHDINYLKCLFKDYNFIVVPENLGKRIRVQIEPMFVKMYMTNTFNNKIIAFNNKTALYAFIINI